MLSNGLFAVAFVDTNRFLGEGTVVTNKDYAKPFYSHREALSAVVQFVSGRGCVFGESGRNVVIRNLGTGEELAYVRRGAFFQRN
jgi:hypothetical protein